MSQPPTTSASVPTEPTLPERPCRAARGRWCLPGGATPRTSPAATARHLRARISTRARRCRRRDPPWARRTYRETGAKPRTSATSASETRRHRAPLEAPRPGSSPIRVRTTSRSGGRRCDHFQGGPRSPARARRAEQGGDRQHRARPASSASRVGARVFMCELTSRARPLRRVRAPVRRLSGGAGQAAAHRDERRAAAKT